VLRPCGDTSKMLVVFRVQGMEAVKYGTVLYYRILLAL